jgi:hypothetical protein
MRRICILAALWTFSFGQQQLGKRDPFNIPLVSMTLGFDKQSGEFKRVRVAIDGNREYAVITRMHDTHVKNTRSGVEKTHYQESPERAFVITEFEARHLNRTVESFIETLESFEKALKRERWGRCLYLDSYLPRFLKRFYYLVCAARNSSRAMPRISRIPDDEYDVSLNSAKSDERINSWRQDEEYIIKLRIISKELAHQLKRWQKKELDNSRRNPEVAYSGKAEEAYELFIRMYFKLKPQPFIPLDEERL